MSEEEPKEKRKISIDLDRITMDKDGNKIVMLGDEDITEKEKRKRPLPIEINEKEYCRLLQYTRSLHHKIAFMLAWESGLRISEVMHLKKEDINVDEKAIRINEGKGCKDRIVPLPKNWMSLHFDYIPIKCSARAIQKAFEMYAEQSGLYKVKPKGKRN